MYNEKGSFACPKLRNFLAVSLEPQYSSSKTHDQSADWSNVETCRVQGSPLSNLLSHTNSYKFLGAVLSTENNLTAYSYRSELNLRSLEPRVPENNCMPADQAFGCSMQRVLSVKNINIIGDEDSSIMPEPFDSSTAGKQPAIGFTDRSDFTFGSRHARQAKFRS